MTFFLILVKCHRTNPQTRGEAISSYSLRLWIFWSFSFHRLDDLGSNEIPVWDFVAICIFSFFDDVQKPVYE